MSPPAATDGVREVAVAERLGRAARQPEPLIDELLGVRPLRPPLHRERVQGELEVGELADERERAPRPGRQRVEHRAARRALHHLGGQPEPIIRPEHLEHERGRVPPRRHPPLHRGLPVRLLDPVDRGQQAHDERTTPRLRQLVPGEVHEVDEGVEARADGHRRARHGDLAAEARFGPVPEHPRHRIGIPRVDGHGTET